MQSFLGFILKYILLPFLAGSILYLIDLKIDLVSGLGSAIVPVIKLVANLAHSRTPIESIVATQFSSAVLGSFVALIVNRLFAAMYRLGRGRDYNASNGKETF